MASTVALYDIQAESLVLGSAINCKDSLIYVADHIDTCEYYNTVHGVIHQHLVKQLKKHGRTDVHLLAKSLESDGELQGVGGVEYLMSLSLQAGVGIHLESYCADIIEHASWRKLYEMGLALQRDTQYRFHTLDEQLEKVRRHLLEIERTTRPDGMPIKAIQAPLRALDEERERLYQERGYEAVVASQGLSTGFVVLDKVLQGLGKSRLVVVGGRTGMGKTAFVLSCAVNAHARGNAVAILSLEMSAGEIAQRMAAMWSGVPQWVLQSGAWDEEQKREIQQAREQLAQGAPLIVDDTPGMRLGELRARARRMKQQHDIGLLVVDYLQLVKGASRQENRQTEIAEISRGLKEVAKELDIPVLVGAQLNRQADKERTLPKISDIRESGAVEQDSDQIILLHRRDYHDPTDRPGEIDLHVAKNRHGQTAQVTAHFEKETGLIRERGADNKITPS